MKPETSQELRGLVREVLKEAMANRAAPAQGTETVRIGYRCGVAGLRGPPFRAPVPSKPFAPENCASHLGKLHRSTSAGDILEGVITEQKISALAAKGTLILGPTAVLTPLARDRARKLGLKIERRR